jgi:hypothetical protein
MYVRVVTAIGLLALAAWSVVRTARPPRAVPATAPDTVFSAERALRHVAQIAQRPHAMGMPDHDRVRDYIVAHLTSLGVQPEIQRATAIGTRYQEAGRVQNILAWIPGAGPRGKAVLLVTHYDGVEAGPAAADDAAAASALLETVRALRAQKTPVARDIIVLFTDGEETGLLGAAAFVREHPWAKDVAVALNFEARGTSGRAFMFETGAGNLDAVRALRKVSDVTAGSVFTTVYRLLPNDTDLSELAVLNSPALNFAFADGVERYHTSHDDIEHLNPGSVQHHGAQMLALARTFGNEPLPRAKTGDAVFFDLPLLGLVVYPETWSLPLAVVALALVVVVAFRERPEFLVGMGAAIVALVLSAFAARVVADLLRSLHTRLPWGGGPRWSGIYACAIALIIVAIVLACYHLARRWSSERAVHAGVVVIWALLSFVLAIKAPGVSYLFTWPVLFAAMGLLLPKFGEVAQWIAAAVTLLLLAGFTYGVAVIMLGVVGNGALALGILTALVVLLTLPLVNRVVEGARWSGSVWPLAAALLLVITGAFIVRRSAAHPVPTSLVYAQNADSHDAWLGSFTIFRDAWTLAAIGPTAPVPRWTQRLSAEGYAFTGRSAPVVAVEAPSVTLESDSVVSETRRVTMRVRAPRGTTGVFVRASGAPVSASAIDGRVVDTTRYRYRTRDWIIEYWAPPDSGATIELTIPKDGKLTVEMTARIRGLPALPGVAIPPRPSYVVERQHGDATYVYKRVSF